MAMPWEMDWKTPKEEKPTAATMPWEMDWSTGDTQEQNSARDRSGDKYMLLPISEDAEGNKSFDSNAGLLGAIKKAFMLPGDVLAGEVDPLSDEGIGRATDFAMTFSPVAARGASPKPSLEVKPRGGFNPVKNRIIGEADDAAAIAQRTRDFRDIGAEPTTGMVSGSARAATKEQALANSGAGQFIQKRIEDAFQKQGDEFNRVVEGITTQNNPLARTTSKQELGDMLRAQAEAAKDAAFKRSEALYDEVGQLTGDHRAVGDATNEFLRTLTKQREGMGQSELLNKAPHLNRAMEQASAIVADLNKGMTFTKLKEARTVIGQLAHGKDIDPTLRTYLEGLRRALTDDMEATARAAGENALQAFRKANNHYRRTVDPETGFGKGSAVDTVINKTTPEEIFGYVMGRTKEGGSRLNAVRRQIEKTPEGKATWDNLTGSVVERMGLKNPDDVGSYDPGLFLRNWKNMAPEAKDVLFKGTNRAQFRQDLDRLARVADDFGKYQKFKNHSNTQTHNTVLSEMNPFDKNSLLAAAFAGPKGFAMAAGAKAANFGTKRYQAKMLTNPETVNWLAGIPKAQVEKGGLRKHVAKLVDIAAKMPDEATRVAVYEYLKEIGYDGQNAR